MKISTPSKRAYYPASKNEPEHLLCWIPEEELARMVRFGQIAPEVLEDYPDGIEVEVSQAAFDEFGIEVGASPEAIKEAYAYYLEHGDIHDTGRVDGATLERAAQETLRGGPEGLLQPKDLLRGPEPSWKGGKFPEPKMTDGEDPRTVMLGLK